MIENLKKYRRMKRVIKRIVQEREKRANKEWGERWLKILKRVGKDSGRE